MSSTPSFPLRPSRLRRGFLTLAAVVGLSTMGATPAGAADLPIGGLPEAAARFVAAPGYVPGANDPRCRTAAGRRTPVVLVHATFVNPGANFADLGPRLRNAGHCAYTFSYGMLPYSLRRVGGVGPIAASARTLDAFVDDVLRQTGAAKVDLVGHSQGGLMPNYFLKRLGGARVVRRFVALAPSNHGTTMNGLTTELPAALGLLGPPVLNTVLGVLDLAAPGLSQQVEGSPFQRALWVDGDTVAGPRYTVIGTSKDTVVTPYENAFLDGPNVRNVLLQDLCPDDEAGHVGLFNDYPTMQLVLNALGDDDPAFRPECRDYGLAG
jgi:triacylglycerol esterase/lipase EstA (alpha/beta hydrolase family)